MSYKLHVGTTTYTTTTTQKQEEEEEERKWREQRKVMKAEFMALMALPSFTPIQESRMRELVEGLEASSSSCSSAWWPTSL